VSTDRDEFAFTSVTALDQDNWRLVISERHTLVAQGAERVSDYQFAMRVGSVRRLSARLAQTSSEVSSASACMIAVSRLVPPTASWR
jgi:hypothetical protein